MVTNLSALLYCWRDGNEPATENGEVAALAQLFQFSSMRVSNTARVKEMKREPPHRSLRPPCLNHQTQKLGDGNIPLNPLTYNDAMTLLNFSHSTQQIRAAETENISLLCMP